MSRISGSAQTILNALVEHKLTNVPPSSVPVTSVGIAFGWWWRWSRILGGVAVLQLFIQLVNAGTGIYLVRSLSKEEYALFTIANSLLSTLLLFSDMGIGVGLTVIGGRVWNERNNLGLLVSTALNLRRRFALLAIVLILPWGLWLLHRNGATWGYSSIFGALLAVTFYATMTSSVYNVVPRLHARYRQVQYTELASASTRLMCSLVAISFAAFAVVATAAAAVAQFVSLFLMRRQSRQLIAPFAGVSNNYRMELIAMVKHLAPTAMFHSFQGQITTWLISLYGVGQQVADLGALMRFGIIFSVVGTLAGQVVVPVLAKCQDRQHLQFVLRRTLLAYAAFAAAMIGISAIWSRPMLWLLGPSYGELSRELILMTASFGLSTFSGLMWSAVSAKGWVERAWVIIPLTLGTQAASLAFFDLGSVSSVLVFGMVSSVPGLMWSAVKLRRGVKECQPVQSDVSPPSQP